MKNECGCEFRELLKEGFPLVQYDKLCPKHQEEWLVRLVNHDLEMERRWKGVRVDLARAADEFMKRNEEINEKYKNLRKKRGV